MKKLLSAWSALNLPNRLTLLRIALVMRTFTNSPIVHGSLEPK